MGRPTVAIPTWHVVQLSLYWFGISAIWGAMNVVLPRRMDDLAGVARAGSALALITAIGAIIAIVVQPTVGAISDYTSSRWGRRKPYIAIGATLDVLFLTGIAFSDTYVSIVAFVALLQFSSNFAQGPFQGYLPDLVPARQVGLASGLLGLMTVVGRVSGIAIASVGLAAGNFVPSLIGVGLLEFATALATLLWVEDGRAAPSRAGRSWWRIASPAWGADIRKEKSFLWLLGSRLFVLMATVAVIDLMFFYLKRSQGLSDHELGMWITIATGVVGITTGVTTFPAARLSDRLGRKALIYASCAIGAFGIAGLVLAPTPAVAVGFAVFIGMAAGAFLAVDWALMTDIIPKAASGRYMGISNVVTGGAGPLAVAIGGVTMDHVGAIDFDLGPRAALSLSLLYYAIGALLLRPVDARRRE